MDINIRQTNNGGFIVTEFDYVNKLEYAYENLIDVLCHIKELGEDSNGRYSDKRLYIIEAPGDKNDNFTEAHSKVIFGELDE